MVLSSGKWPSKQSSIPKSRSPISKNRAFFSGLINSFFRRAQMNLAVDAQNPAGTRGKVADKNFPLSLLRKAGQDQDFIFLGHLPDRFGAGPGNRFGDLRRIPFHEVAAEVELRETDRLRSALGCLAHERFHPREVLGFVPEGGEHGDGCDPKIFHG